MTGTYYMHSNTRKRDDCQRNYYQGKELGSGLYGTVHEACKDKPCRGKSASRYVIKVSLLIAPGGKKIDNELLQNAYHDYYFMSQLQSTGLVPKVYDFWFCDNSMAFLVMERMDKNFADVLEHQNQHMTLAQERRLRHILATLNSLEIIHDDIRAPNMMVKGNQLYLIDFGRAGNFQRHKNPLTGRAYQMVPYSFRGRELAHFYKTAQKRQDLLKYWDKVLMEAYFKPPYEFVLFRDEIPKVVYRELAAIRNRIYSLCYDRKQYAICEKGKSPTRYATPVKHILPKRNTRRAHKNSTSSSSTISTLQKRYRKLVADLRHRGYSMKEIAQEWQRMKQSGDFI